MPPGHYPRKKKTTPCRRCGGSEFSNPPSASGRRCLVCRRISAARWREQYPERQRESQKQSDARRSNEKWLWTWAKVRAKKIGVPFTIRVEDIVIPLVCPVLGIPLSRAVGRHGHHDASPTLDRIDPARGYIRDNIAVISWRANRLKGDATVSEMASVLAYMRTNRAFRLVG